MRHLEKIVEYAQSMAHRDRRGKQRQWRYGSFYDLVLAHGRIFEPAPLPDAVYPALAGHCFQAATIVSDQHGVAYVEGLALLPDTQTVIEHAWCTTWQGQVIDPSLQGNTATAYLGIAFTRDFRRQAVTRNAGRWSVLLADPHNGSPPNQAVLEHGLPAGATVPLGTALTNPLPPPATTPHRADPTPDTWPAFAATNA